MEGVRRAKAWEQCGAITIRAQVFYADGTSGPMIDVAPDQLLSPKMEIDLTDPLEKRRYWRLWAKISGGQGYTIRPISIMPGGRGTPLKSVVLRF